MRAAVLFGKEDIRVIEWPDPILESGDVLVRVASCGICGSDLRTYFKGPSPRYRLPVILGHEFVGAIVAMGTGVSGFEVGERVVAAPAVPCGECFYCQRGQDNLCRNLLDFGINVDGAFAEFVRIPAKLIARGGLIKLDAALTDSDAIWAEPIGTVLHGEERAGTGPGQTVVIVGDGPIALLHALVAKRLGAESVYVMGHHPERLDLARRVGADIVTSTPHDVPIQVADVVVVAVSDPAAVTHALNYVHDGGTVIAFGGTARDAEVSLSLHRLHYGEITIAGSFNCTADDFRRAVSLIPHLNLKPLAPLIVPLGHIVDGFHAAQERRVIKAVVHIGA